MMPSPLQPRNADGMCVCAEAEAVACLRPTRELVAEVRGLLCAQTVQSSQVGRCGQRR